MAEFDKDPSVTDDSANHDVISDLETLSKKYGIAFDPDKYKVPSQNSQYTPHAPGTDPSRIYNPPKNNHPARTPRIVYDAQDPSNSVKVIYEDAGAPQGPQGRRVIYQEEEPESIADKRRRNAANAPQKTAKGSQGFGSQPYVRHVASSESAVKRDDAEAFTKAYEQKKTEPEAPQPEAETTLTGSSRSVAKGEKKPVHQHYEETAGEKTAKFFKSFLPWKGDGAKEVIRKLIMDISAILVLICFGFFIDNYIQHQDQLKNQDSLKVTESQTTDELEAQWAAIKAKYPDVDFPEGMNIKFAELYAANQDMVGYLHIDNTNIDTPVVQNKGDIDSGAEDFYLRHNFYKSSDKYGVAYLDAYNTGSSLDKNNTIYGHNMTDGLAFAQLEKYYTIDGFKESPVIQYSTLFKDYYFKVYAVIITNGYPSGDNGYLFNYIAAFFPTDENFEGFIEALDERKLYDTGVDINKDDKLITLSTCSYKINKTDMGRLAVIGRLVRDGESTAVDTSLAQENTNVRYPQIWYDEHKMTNPYANAYQWESQ